MRCLTLADEMKKLGNNVVFVCKKLDFNLINKIIDSGYEVKELPVAPWNNTNSLLAHAEWLEGSQEDDAEETKAAIKSLKPDWLIVDHYSLDYCWESMMRQICKNIMVIDDLSDRRHDCDLLLNQNYGSSPELYSKLVTNKCIQLHGPDYALINPVYLESRQHKKLQIKKIDRVLIYFGGSDVFNLTEMTIRAFQVPMLSYINLDIVIGNSYTYKEELYAAVGSSNRTKIYTNLSNLSELMIKADLAIGAAGSTTWERLCMGLPSIIVTVAENQISASEALSNDGLVHYLGHASEITPVVIQEKLLDLISRPDELYSLSNKNRSIVDGEGVFRVQNAITSFT